MGYDTEFRGQLNLSRRLTKKESEYLHLFSNTRRMKRNASITNNRPDPARKAVGLTVGTQGEYFVGEQGFAGQDMGSDVLEYNTPPVNQPGLWCNWVPTENRKAIEWNGTEKFYYYEEWLSYIIEHFLTPWGISIVGGEIEWRGEDWDDTGTLTVVDGVVVCSDE